jgi:integrase
VVREAARRVSPFRSHGRGSLVLKGTFAGVRIERASGTRDAKHLEKLRAMLHVLADTGRLDVLKAVAAGRVKVLALWPDYRAGRWERLPTAEHALPFAAQFAAWRATKGASYARYARWVGNAIGSIATLAELRPVLLRYRAACETAGTGSMFNHVMATVRAFLRDTVTTDHPLYANVRAIARLPEPAKRPKHPQRPEQAAKIRAALAAGVSCTHCRACRCAALGPELGRIWWILCCTGMLPDEYFAGKWAVGAVEDGRLHIRGTKRAARDRVVPLLTAVAPAAISQDVFEDRLRRSGLGVRPKDGRDTFALWCDLARLPLAWKRALLGHAAGDVTQEYGWQEPERIVDEAGDALRTLLAPVGQSVGQPAAPSGPSPDATTPKPRSAVLTPAQAGA